MSYVKISDAVTDMLELFQAVWIDDHLSPLPFEVPGMEFDTADFTPNDVWARWRCDHEIQGQASLAGGDGKRKWERTGLISIELNTPPSAGIVQAYDLAETVAKAYQGQRTAGDAWFRNVRIVESSPQDNSGVWFKINVFAEFTYEQIS